MTSGAGGGRKGIRECPIFHPTPEEFSNFEKYVLSIEPQCLEYGICKVVPPVGWKPRTTPYEDLDDLVLTGPVRQEALGHSGTYQCMNVTQKPLTIGEYRMLARKEENLPPMPELLTLTPEQRAKEDFLELEKKYWQGFAGAKPPVYGADHFGHGTFFEESAGAWNLSRLDSLLRRRINITMPGINAPMLYMGMWRATFAWHVEDMDLYSINFLHYGGEKIWYAASAADGPRLERVAASIFPNSANRCGQFLRHKMHIINPALITSAGITLTRVVHRAGEFVISFPFAYHQGFNVSLNCAESCNFASETWVPFGMKVKPCKCAAAEDSARIKMSIFTCEKASAKQRRSNASNANADGANHDIICEMCGKAHAEDTILLCNSCTAGYHMQCLTPALTKRPSGPWLCPDCHKEEEEESRLAEEKASKNRKCCACGSRGEEAAVHHLLASAWAGVSLEFGPAEPGLSFLKIFLSFFFLLFPFLCFASGRRALTA